MVVVDLVSGDGDVLEAGADVSRPSAERSRDEETRAETAHSMTMALTAVVHDDHEE